MKSRINCTLFIAGTIVLTTLMRDPIYRLDVCQKSQGYPSIPGFKVNPY
jgi:hypothetical protein